MGLLFWYDRTAKSVPMLELRKLDDETNVCQTSERIHAFRLVDLQRAGGGANLLRDTGGEVVQGAIYSCYEGVVLHVCREVARAWRDLADDGRDAHVVNPGAQLSDGKPALGIARREADRTAMDVINRSWCRGLQDLCLIWISLGWVNVLTAIDVFVDQLPGALVFNEIVEQCRWCASVVPFGVGPDAQSNRFVLERGARLSARKVRRVVVETGDSGQATDIHALSHGLAVAALLRLTRAVDQHDRAVSRVRGVSRGEVCSIHRYVRASILRAEGRVDRVDSRHVVLEPCLVWTFESVLPSQRVVEDLRGPHGQE
eukprot:751567-Hanusia_phi.AAC.2